MITLYESRYSKADLSEAPEAEKVLYFILGEVANEVTVLSKQLVFWLHPKEGEDEAETFARTSGAIITTKLLAGRLYEAWNVLREAHHAKVFSSYKADLDDEANDALVEIKNYFKKENLIDKLRNKVAFHTDFDVMRDALEDFPESEPLIDFINQQAGNTFYNAAHLISVYALKGLTGQADLATAIARMADEIITMSGHVGRYVHGFVAVFHSRHIAIRHLFLPSSERRIGGAPSFDEICTPFFCEHPAVSRS